MKLEMLNLKCTGKRRTIIANHILSYKVIEFTLLNSWTKSRGYLHDQADQLCISFYLVFNCCSITVVPIFLPLLPAASPISQYIPPPCHPCPWVLCICSLSWPSYPHYPLPASPLVTVSLFFISMSLVLFCLLVCFAD